MILQKSFWYSDLVVSHYQLLLLIIIGAQILIMVLIMSVEKFLLLNIFVETKEYIFQDSYMNWKFKRIELI